MTKCPTEYHPVPVAYATMSKCPTEYDSVPDEMWTPPKPGTLYSADQICAMPVKGTPMTLVNDEKREKIAVQQEAETAESLQRVSADLPEGVGGGSQLAEAAEEVGNKAQKEAPNKVPKLGDGKGRVAYDESEEQPLYEAALMTAIAEWLNAAVGQGVAPAEAQEPEITAFAGQSTAFRLLVKCIAGKV